jgi:hypothetical protein
MAEIPIIPADASIDIPNVVRPPIEPGAGVEELSNASEALANQAAALGMHFKRIRQQIQFDQADGEAAEMMDQARAKVMLDPQFRNDPQAAQAETTRQLGEIGDQILQKYPYADANGALSKNLAIRSSHYAFSNFLDAHVNQERNLRDQSEAIGDQTVSYAANPASDPREVATRVNNYAGEGGRIDQDVAAGLFTAGEGQLRKQLFNQKLATAQFQTQAFTNPEDVLRMPAPPPGVPPEAFEQTVRLATDRLEAGQNAIEVDLKQHQAAAEQEIANDAQNGQPIGAKLEAFGAHFSAAPGGREFYEAYSGHPYRQQGDPAIAKQLSDGIMDGTADRVTVLTAMASNGIDARQAALLNAELQERDRASKTTMGAAEDRSWRDIESAIRSSYFTDPGTLSQARNDFKVAKDGAKKASDFDEITKTLIGKYAPSTSAAPTPASPTKAAISAKLKAAGGVGVVPGLSP